MRKSLKRIISIALIGIQIPLILALLGIPFAHNIVVTSVTGLEGWIFRPSGL